MNEEEIIELVFRPKKTKVNYKHKQCPICGNDKVSFLSVSDGSMMPTYACGFSQYESGDLRTFCCND